jgi:pyridoxamine 5'-phosphate oxidase
MKTELMTVFNAEIMNRFQHLLREARHCDPNAFTLASVDKQGLPGQRTVTMIHFDEQGLVFFSSSQSRKGQHFAKNNYASACFYWHSLHQQVEFAGSIEILGNEQADEFWRTRERDSQISAWASRQSEQLESRGELLAQVKQVKARFRDIQIPRPSYWLAYRLIPGRVEFWKSGWSRLHERICFEIRDGSWQQNLLYP